MEWIVKIEGKEEITNKSIILGNQRILIRFDPKQELLFFIGQYKPHNKNWIDFSIHEHSMEIDLETIQDFLFKAVDTMRKRLTAYNNIAEGFNAIKLIEIKEEEE